MMLTNIFMNGNGYWISNAQNTEQTLDDQRKTIIIQSTWLLSCKSSATTTTNIKARIIENFRQKTSLTREDKGLLQMELIMNSHSWASDGCLWGNGRVTNFTKTSYICLYLMLLPASPHSKCKPCPRPSIKGFRWECLQEHPKSQCHYNCQTDLDFHGSSQKIPLVPEMIMISVFTWAEAKCAWKITRVRLLSKGFRTYAIPITS